MTQARGVLMPGSSAYDARETEFLLNQRLLARRLKRRPEVRSPKLQRRGRGVHAVAVVGHGVRMDALRDSWRRLKVH